MHAKKAGFSKLTQRSTVLKAFKYIVLKDSNTQGLLSTWYTALFNFNSAQLWFLSL